MTVDNVLFVSPRGSWQRDDRLRKGLEEIGCTTEKTESVFNRSSMSRDQLRSVLTGDYSPITVFVVAVLWVFLDSISQILSLVTHTAAVRQADIMYVENTASYAVFAAKFYGLIWRTPVVYDPHGGMYYAQVVGRGIVDGNSSLAGLWYHLDRYAAKVSDIYILGSYAQKTEFQNMFCISGENICVIYTGADEDRFNDDHSERTKDVDFFYWGTFIPFHRVDLIVEAAKLVDEDLSIVLAGEGTSPETEQLRQNMIEKVEDENIQNVEFLGWVDQEELEQYIASANLVAGYYSENPKINLTISNKIGEATYMRKTVLSAHSPALEEVFTHTEDIFFCEPCSYESLADGISEYATREHEMVGANARETYDEHLSSTASARRLIEQLESSIV